MHTVDVSGRFVLKPRPALDRRARSAVDEDGQRRGLIARLANRWAVAASVVVALVVRLPRLSHPGVLVFDEIYWVPGAVDLLQWGSTHGQFRHPPLGQWLIASGISTFGLDPFGWRIGALVAGVGTVGIVAATARRLTRDEGLAFCAGMLCALDGVMFTTSRVGMLDAFTGLFTSLAVYAMMLLWQARTSNDRSQTWVRVLAMVAVGLAASVKWYGFLLVPVLAGVLIAVDRRQGRSRGRAVRSVVLAVVVPLCVYLVTWVPQQFGPDPWSPRSFVATHVDVARYHLDLRPDNTNAASAWSWFDISHPTILYAQDCGEAVVRDHPGTCDGAAADSGAVIMAQPNPVVWLIDLVALAGLVVAVARRRGGTAAILLGAVASQWLLWLVNRREAYTFYLTTIIPTLCVAAAWLAGDRKGRRPLLIGGVIAAAGMFVFFYPTWTATPISNHALGLRMWWWGLGT